jgi:putative flavoprotein involved in K+ transport
MAEAIVLGAGAAGLAAAVTLRDAGVDAVVLERSDKVAASWRSRYDGLRLNTTGWMSTQPGYRATRKRYGEFPSRDQWIEYLENYSEHHKIEVLFGTEVQRVWSEDGGWRLETELEELATRFVVVATGFDHDPDTPDWPGRDGFTGDLIHSAEYRNPEPYRDRDVLVVGPGTTGSEVAYLLARGGAGRVRVACRTPPDLMPRKILGASINISGILLNHVPLRVADQASWLSQRIIFGDLEPYGLPRAPHGLATTLSQKQQAPAYDSGFVSFLKAGRIEIVPAVAGFDGRDVLLADKTRIQPEAVIAATGYRRGLERLVGHLGVLDDDGIPLVCGGHEHPTAPGLFFTGYRIDLSGQLRLMRPDARAIARAVRRRRRKPAVGAHFIGSRQLKSGVHVRLAAHRSGKGPVAPASRRSQASTASLPAAAGRARQVGRRA